MQIAQAARDLEQEGHGGVLLIVDVLYLEDQLGHAQIVILTVRRQVLTDRGAVHHVELDALSEALPADVKRPATAGKRVADSFVQFVMSRRLPDWVVAHLRDSGETNNHPEAPRGRGRTGRSRSSEGQRRRQRRTWRAGPRAVTSVAVADQE